MNKRNMSFLSDESQIEDLLTKMQPVPSEGFHKKMERAHWRIKQAQPGAVKGSELVSLGVNAMFLASSINPF